ncbi:hypothetical protein [Desulfatiglans anilini]|uniref:hypothetical protein n=1 Tax=Desulfatiglans anilini TaxID=90728 RepID=UPI00042468D4|nr:hypothetical protein [Desulfatiglans anilini]
MKLVKSFLAMILMVLVFPGLSFGAMVFELDHPGTAYVGDTFDLTVKIVGTDSNTDPLTICGYETLLGFDPEALELTAYQGEPFFPSGLLGPQVYTPTSVPPSSPGTFGSMDITLDDAPGFPYGGATATFTFKCLKAGVATFSLTGTNLVTDCLLFDNTDITSVTNPSITVNEKPVLPAAQSVPTIGGYGMLLLIFGMGLGALWAVRRKTSALKR